MVLWLVVLSARAQEPVVREVERGVYLKAGLGGSVLPSGQLWAGLQQNLAVGGDLVDRERVSAGWEAGLTQQLFKGPKYDPDSAQTPRIQGHLFSVMGSGVLEVSVYPWRRIGLGVRAGAGGWAAPLLILPDVTDGTLHGRPTSVLLGGPTLEVYTKLAHFSVGVDVDFLYVIGFDLAISPTGTVKYTF